MIYPDLSRSMNLSDGKALVHLTVRGGTPVAEFLAVIESWTEGLDDATISIGHDLVAGAEVPFVEIIGRTKP